jgi:Protein of unknwon function (DUF3310)
MAEDPEFLRQEIERHNAKIAVLREQQYNRRKTDPGYVSSPPPELIDDMREIELKVDPVNHPTPVDDPVNHPAHYTEHPSGIECIQITEWMSFNVGNAVKYLWRCDLKRDAIEDLRKAIWYIQREIAKREKGG